MKKIVTLLVSLFVSGVATAQDATEAAGSFWDNPLADPLLPLYIVIGFIFIVALLVIIVAAYMIKILNMFVRKEAEEKAAKEGREYVPEPSWWSRFDREVLTGAVPIEKENTIVLDHNYDGIRELDNHLPPWWKALFYGCIIWGIGYLIVYHVGGWLPLQTDEYQAEVAAAEVQIAKYKASQPTEAAVDVSAMEYSDDADIIAAGKKIFDGQCASCHLADGGGMIGPNLVDEYWLHGGGIQDIYTTIEVGVPEKGMISWKGVLSPEQIKEVSFYIMSIRGTTPANPKAPQGEKYVPAEVPGAVPADNTPVPVDSVQASL